MTSRVLIADDSLTIQKVIGITLANSGYELIECLNETDLLNKVLTEQFDLVLLDFNLSDSQSGYDLSNKIHASIPHAAIIVMLGTFDTVDESKFNACGITDKIVKPFESSKFIKKCRDVLEGGRPSVILKSESESEVSGDDVSINKIDDLDSWKVDAPQMHSRESIEESHVDEISHDVTLDPLSSEIEGWGFTPSHSIEEKFQKVFPPIIEEASEGINVLNRLQTSSQFAQYAHDEDYDLDATDPSFEIPEDLNRNLLNEIEEDISAEAFWAVDEVVPVKSEEQDYISDTNFDEVTTDLTDTIKAYKEIPKETSKETPKETAKEILKTEEKGDSAVFHIDQDAIVEKLKISLRPMIEEMVKEFCRQSAEKVAWEVIPDLAENLIRKEIKEISESVQH